MTSPTAEPQRTLRRLSARQWVGVVGLALVMLAALIITLNPTPVDSGRGNDVRAFLDLLHGVAVPESFGYTELEVTANVVMFFPLGLFFGLIVTGRWWWLAVAAPLALSVCIELTQLFLLPERYADISDVIANTLGGWLGLGLAALIPVRGSHPR